MTLEPASEFFAVCVNNRLKITCSTTASVLAWTLIPNQESPGNSEHIKEYNSASSLEDVGMIGDFILGLESKDPLLSTATLDDIDPKHNGSVLRCANDLAYQKASETAEITILVKGKLHYICNMLPLCAILYMPAEHVSFRNCIVIQIFPQLR